MTKISSLPALAGADVDTATDLLPIVDASEAGDARNKKMTVGELGIAMREIIQDVVGGLLAAGTNVTLTYDDTGNVLTINSATAPADISGFNEAVDDRVAALIVAGSGVSKSYNDGAGTLTITAVAPTNGMTFKSTIDCSANPNYPAALTGECYLVSVAGKIGGASGEAVDIGDYIVAIADNAGGTDASVGASWIVLEHNSPTVAAYTDAQARTAVGRAMRFFFTTTPTASEVLAIDVAEQAYTIPANLSGWRAAKLSGTGVNPAATFVITIKQNGTDIGTISISTSGVVTLATVSGTAKSIASGDVLSFHGPATADTTVANWAINGKGIL